MGRFCKDTVISHTQECKTQKKGIPADTFVMTVGRSLFRNSLLSQFNG